VTALARLDAARRELSAQTARGAAGRIALQHFSDHLDALLQELFAEAPSPSCDVAVVALGGYGRRHLCLHSDVDVLVLFDGPIRFAGEEFLRALLHPLWDLHLVVGHQVREVADFSRLETDNPTFLLALVDARLVAGNRSLLDRVMSTLETADSRAQMLQLLRRLIDQRHAAFNDTLYQLEPDIKDAPGALRDVNALRTIAELTDPSLLSRGPADPDRLDQAEEFFLRIRSILHLQRQRNDNILTHELQEKSAEILNYTGDAPRQQVERLMSDYFRHARGVSRALEWVRQTAPVPVGINLVLSGDGIRFCDPEQARARPQSWLGVFQTALDSQSPVAYDTLGWIRQHIDRCAPEDFFPTAVDREALLTFLRPRAGLYARLSEMHDCGLLGRMFPEFGAISSRVVRDFYHKYTVDEHTLLTIRSLERLAAAPPAGRERFAALLADLATPELLVLALLFHDVGKWRDEDHAAESCRMARQMLERLQFPPASRELVEFLIQNHLEMSRWAFRRDTEDPEVVRQFAELVRIEEQLKMLCLMTLADVEAVSPDTMTPWREELLWRFYVDTYNHLTLGYGDELIERSQSELSELLAGSPPSLSEQEIRRFVEGLPRRYLRLFAPDAVYRHVQLSRDIQPDHVQAALEQKGSAWELTVVTLDKPFLFSNICGVLSLFGMDILRGYAMTNPNGLVLDNFQFTDRERFLELNAAGGEHILRALENVVSGSLDVTARLRAREQSILNRRSGVPRFAPLVHCDNRSSHRYTILDIVANNAVGLLHRISRVISRDGCDVDLVLISTEGEKAIDVFHITQGGTKLAEAAELQLTTDLRHALEGDDEVD
jgi:[protein-PII] uridylyltransferase